MKYIMVGVAVLGVITATQNILNTPPQPVAVASHGVLHAKTIKHTSIAQKPPEPPTCATEIQKYDWNKDQAYRIMMKESGGNALTVNDNPSTGDYSVGCFQVNLIGRMKYTRPSEQALKDPVVNVQFAYNLYKKVGFCSTAGWYNTCKKLGY